jgi:hypothetical protein
MVFNATFNNISVISWQSVLSERKFHIASCSLVIDFSVNVWDVRRPYIPFASFEEHKNVATGTNYILKSLICRKSLKNFIT